MRWRNERDRLYRSWEQCACRARMTGVGQVFPGSRGLASYSAFADLFWFHRLIDSLETGR